MSLPTWSHQAVLSPHRLSAAQARALVSEVLRDHDLMYLIEDVKLVASELATNAVLHAGEPFTLTLRGDDDWVVLRVSDSSLLPPVRVAADGMATNGRGLAIVDSISHDWGVDHGNGAAKSVWASFQVTPESVSPT
jgi:anti-sigma regulatory factor (Ser/Thr protein kinase)